MFHHQRKGTLSSSSKPLKELTRTVTTDVFLAESKRQILLKKIHVLMNLETSRYDSLCGMLIENLVHYCQNLPEASNSYYSQPGGLVDYALNRTEAALSLFQEYVLYGTTDSLSEEQKLWQYVLYSAALMQGIGKLFVDYRVGFYDIKGQFLKEWNPLLEHLSSTGIYYFYTFQKETESTFRRRLNLLLAKILIPSSGFAWIASNPDALAVWLSLLNEDESSCGTLGALLIRSDAIAIQRYLLEHMLSIGTQGRRYQAGTFSGQPDTLLEKEQALGLAFIQWMVNALGEGRLMVNKAPLFMVPGGTLMTPELFQLFVREHPEYKNWQAAQKGFLSLALHHCAADGGVMSRFEAKGQKMQTGIVFSKYALALPESVKVYQTSTEKVVSLSATELIHKGQFISQFIQKHNLSSITSLQKLNAAGKWQSVANEPHAPKSGAKKGG